MDTIAQLIPSSPWATWLLALGFAGGNVLVARRLRLNDGGTDE